MNLALKIYFDFKGFEKLHFSFNQKATIKSNLKKYEFIEYLLNMNIEKI